jgi:predicted DNA-binding transcriptional regulator AlpA
MGLLRLRPEGFRNLLRAGFPQPIRFNSRLLRWRKADVEAYLNSLQQAA